MQCLYVGDAYVLRDGATVTPPIHPVKGVKQGCPLSPLLFALFMSDIASSLEAGELPVGVPLGPGPHTLQSHHISHIMFADDLTLLGVSCERLQVVVDRLALYAQRKGLVVNVRKCAVMSWPRQTNAQGEKSVQYSGQALPRVKAFKFLGMWLDERFSMGHAAEKQRGPVMAAWRAVQQQAQEQGLRRIPHAFCTWCKHMSCRQHCLAVRCGALTCCPRALFTPPPSAIPVQCISATPACQERCVHCQLAG